MQCEHYRPLHSPHHLRTPRTDIYFIALQTCCYAAMYFYIYIYIYIMQCTSAKRNMAHRFCSYALLQPNHIKTHATKYFFCGTIILLKYFQLVYGHPVSTLLLLRKVFPKKILSHDRQTSFGLMYDSSSCS